MATLHPNKSQHSDPDTSHLTSAQHTQHESLDKACTEMAEQLLTLSTHLLRVIIIEQFPFCH